jgi:hypothetical protein
MGGVMQRQFNYRKKGPGRIAFQGTGKGKKLAGQYGKGLKVQFNRALRAKSKAVHLHDKHGAVTLVGRDPITGVRRIWVAGISAQRGY